MLVYYDERAPEYEEAYTLGTGTASITEPEVFKAEALLLAGIVGQIGRGRIMDLACGTAYWLPHYARNCRHMTLFDQSDNMLAEARERRPDWASSTGATSFQATSSNRNSASTFATRCWSASF